MTTTNSWHVDDDALRAWVDGSAGSLTSVSVEQHLMRCEQCRTAVAVLVPTEPLVDTWEGTLATVETPRAGLLERLLRRLGASTADSMVLSAATALRAAWLAGTIIALGLAVVGPLITGSDGQLLFLVIAPLIPVAGVALAYGPGADPAYEAVLVAPYAMVRLILLRTALVLTTSVPLVVGAGLLLAMPSWLAVACLLPAAGFVALVLTASSWIEPEPAAGIVAAGWLLVVVWAQRVGDPLVLFSAPAVTGYLVAAVAGSLVFAVRTLGRTPAWRLH